MLYSCFPHVINLAVQAIYTTLKCGKGLEEQYLLGTLGHISEAALKVMVLPQGVTKDDYLKALCQCTIFMGFSKLLFPSSNPPYIRILTITTLWFTNHTTQEQQDNSFHCKNEYKTGNCYVYTNPPPLYWSTKSPSTGEVSTTCPKPRGVPPLRPDH